MSRILFSVLFCLSIALSGPGIASAANVRVVEKIYSTAGDGLLSTGSMNYNCTWNNARGQSSVSDAMSTVDEASFGFSTSNKITYVYYVLGRSFFAFNTLLPESTIVDAKLSLYVTGTGYADNDDECWMNVVEGFQASNNGLQGDDWVDAGSVNGSSGQANSSGIQEGAERVRIENIPTGAYYVWTLNSTGLTWVDKSGYTKLSLREGHDLLNVPTIPSTGSWIGNSVTGYYSEHVGTDKDPFLLITYLCDELDAPEVGPTSRGEVISVTSEAVIVGTNCSIIGTVTDTASVIDLNSNGFPEMVLYGLNTANSPVVCVADINTGDVLYEYTCFGPGWEPNKLIMSPDLNSDGIPDVSPAAYKPTTGESKILIMDTVSTLPAGTIILDRLLP